MSSSSYFRSYSSLFPNFWHCLWIDSITLMSPGKWSNSSTVEHLLSCSKILQNIRNPFDIELSSRINVYRQLQSIERAREISAKLIIMCFVPCSTSYLCFLAPGSILGMCTRKKVLASPSLYPSVQTPRSYRNKWNRLASSLFMNHFLLFWA